MPRGVVGGSLRGHFQSNGQPKNGYPTREEALAAMNALIANPGFRSSRRKALNVYKCEVCGAYHLGHRKAGDAW